MTTEQILKNKSVQATAMRTLVLEQFVANKAAKSLIELENAMPRADRTTIYRTLKTFLQKGILHEINDGNNARRYALCSEHCVALNHVDTHPHFHCIKCGETVCLETISIELPKLPKGYQPDSFEITAKGICPTCE